MKRDETFVHVAIRNYLKAKGWTLISGQYPGGSDDELHVFNIFDPELAKDESPDHRRHSAGKFVPDLIVYKDKTLLVIEAKPEYSISDKEKLTQLLSVKRKDFINGLNKFAQEKGFSQIIPVEKLRIIPVLAFLSEAIAPKDGHAYLKVFDLENIHEENF